MKKILSIFVTSVLTLNSLNVLALENNEKGQNEALTEQTTLIMQVSPTPPDETLYVGSINTAKAVIESIDKFIRERINLIDTLEYVKDDTKKELTEELSDLKTRLGRVETGISGMTIESFNTDMPEIQIELKEINQACLDLNEKQETDIQKALNAAYLEEHHKLYVEFVNFVEDYKDLIKDTKTIQAKLDEIEELIEDLENEFDTRKWDDLDESWPELIKLTKIETDFYKQPQR